MKTLINLFESGEAPTSLSSLPYNSNNMGKFAVTIKCVKQGYFATIEDLRRTFNEMLHKYQAIENAFVIEQDSLGRNHAHCTITAKKSLRYTSFKKKYWHIFIKRLYKDSDTKRWNDYIHLDQEIQMKSFLKDIQSDYCFVDGGGVASGDQDQIK